MKPSPLTYLSVQFIQVHVAADFKAKVKAPEFNFEGALIGISIKHGFNSEDGSWWVAVGFRSTNPPKSKVLSPYIIDIFAMGNFLISDSVKDAERIVYENGAALVYGSIRDMVSSITSRGSQGLLMLPTPTFMGEFELYKANMEAKSLEEDKPSKSRTKKNLL